MTTEELTAVVTRLREKIAGFEVSLKNVQETADRCRLSRKEAEVALDKKLDAVVYKIDHMRDAMSKLEGGVSGWKSVVPTIAPVIAAVVALVTLAVLLTRG